MIVIIVDNIIFILSIYFLYFPNRTILFLFVKSSSTTRILLIYNNNIVCMPCVVWTWSVLLLMCIELLQCCAIPPPQQHGCGQICPRSFTFPYLLEYEYMSWKRKKEIHNAKNKVVYTHIYIQIYLFICIYKIHRQTCRIENAYIHRHFYLKYVCGSARPSTSMNTQCSAQFLYHRKQNFKLNQITRMYGTSERNNNRKKSVAITMNTEEQQNEKTQPRTHTRTSVASIQILLLLYYISIYTITTIIIVVSFFFLPLLLF